MTDQGAQMTEEEEIQAALMARIAQRAELASSARTAPTGDQKFSLQTKAPVRPVAVVQPAINTANLRPNGSNDNRPNQGPKLTNNKKFMKRFKFAWDASDDTYSPDYLRDNARGTSSTGPIPSDKLLQLVDERSSRSGSKIEKTWKDVMDKPIHLMEERDWRIVRENFEIKVRGKSVVHPARSWDEMNLPPHLRKVIDKIGYTKPTPIQMQAIPIGLGPSDVVGVAETGSGKTCAFVMPLLVRLSREPWLSRRLKCADDGPLAMILGPTRELVNQIDEEVTKLGSLDPMPVRSCAVIGGGNADEQGVRLQNGVDVVVATPGRLIDLLESRVAVINQCQYLVLDEADRMIDMGFESQVNKIIDRLVIKKEERTTFLFSATMPPEVIAMSERYMRDTRIIIRIGDEDATKNKRIDQYVYVLPNEAAKTKELMRILSREEPPIIIFCNSKAGCDSLVKELKAHGRRAAALHAGRNQDEREGNLRSFKEGEYDILVATDVAGRGLDIEGVSHVINYDCPNALDRYCHRIGRTGRAGRSGKASTFIVKGADDLTVASDIADFMKQSGQKITHDFAELISHIEANIED